VIKPGDNYSALAKKYLGHAKYASLIAKANPGMLPRRLMVGAKVKIPNLPKPSDVDTRRSSAAASPVHRLMAEPAPSVPKDRAYTVKEGEGWSSLAERYLGEGSRWPELFELNRERVPRNPNVLPAGTVIELPAKSVKK
jgi:nucleoid-associated protein YgaU